ncbi:MAG: putative ABC transport system permease protein [Roseivirga sp.]|jgi:putative ABC transport system permease protein
MRFLKTVLRSFKRSPLLSGLNILGLSIGLGSFLVISLYLFQENSYEKGFADSERIYRVEEEFLSMGTIAMTSSNLEFRLPDFPEVELHSRLSDLGAGTKVIVEEKRFDIKRAFAADSNYFKLFNYDFLVGNAQEALSGPRQVVLSEATALRFFGTTDVIGKTIMALDFGSFNIVGVVSTKVLKSHLDFEVIFTSIFPNTYSTSSWFGIGGYSYVKLKKGVTPVQFKDQLDAMTARDVYPAIHPSKELPFEEWLNSPNKVSFVAKPIQEIYLNSSVQFEIYQNGDRQTRVTLSIIALFILFVASINFMNLTTAKSSQRTKEIGVRKVLGATKTKLIRYFLGETLLVTFLSTLLGAGLSELFIRVINSYWGADISISLITYPSLIGYLVLFVIGLGLLSGIYPALFLSSAKMIPLLKGMKLGSVLNLTSSRNLRNGLVILQFAIATTLIIGSIFINDQLKHLKNMDLGFNQDQVLVIKNMPLLKDSKYTFKTELMRNPAIKQASFTNRLPADGIESTTSTMLDPQTTFTLSHFMTDEYLHKVLGLKIIDGEWFNPEKQQYDSLTVINRTAARALGFENPVGEIFGNYWTIIGVVEDFYFGGLREAVQPAMFMYTPEQHRNLALQIDSKDVSIAEIEQVWSSFSSEPLEYYYLDQNFEGQLQKESQNAKAVLTLTILAILISCLGLFGLAAFTADERVHEFGVRKILGASVTDIIRHFGGSFIRLIMLAFFVSIPLAYYGVEIWLEGFANRTSITIWPFLLAGFLAIAIGVGTILFQSIKTGRLNPVDTLRNE